MKYLFKLLLVLLLTSTVLFAENFKKPPYDKRLDDYPNIKKLYEASDSSISSYKLGMFYIKKLKDKEEGIKWLKKAYSKGNKDAAYQLAFSEKENATMWLDRAVKLGSCEAMYTKGNRSEWSDVDVSPLQQGKDVWNSYEESTQKTLTNMNNRALYWYKKSYANGCKAVALDIGYTYYDTKSYEAATMWFERAIVEDKKALLDVGDIYRSKDPAIALKYFKRAYDLHLIDAAYYLAKTYHENIKNYHMALKWYIIGLQQRNKKQIKAFSEFMNDDFVDFQDSRDAYIDSLTLMFLLQDSKISENDVVKYLKKRNRYEEDIELAKKRYKKIKSDPAYYFAKKYKMYTANKRLLKEIQTHSDLAESIGLMYLDEKEYTEAIKYFKYAVKLKSDKALFYIGYTNHAYLKKYNEAIKWYEQSFEKDHQLNAAFNIAQIYQTNLHDYAKAIFWYTKTFEQKDIPSSYEIAQIYYYDLHNKEKAKEWYEKGVKQGYQKSIDTLTELFHTESELKTYLNDPKEKTNEYGETALLSAVRLDDMAKIKELLDNGANINHHSSKTGVTALKLAVIKQNILMIKLLLQYKPSLDLYKPLFDAATRKNYEIVKLLIQSGADINVQDNIAGDTVLHYAALHNDLQLGKIALESGIDKNILNYNGFTALQYAKNTANHDMIELITSAQAENHNKAKKKKEAGTGK